MKISQWSEKGFNPRSVCSWPDPSFYSYIILPLVNGISDVFGYAIIAEIKYAS